MSNPETHSYLLLLFFWQSPLPVNLRWPRLQWPMILFCEFSYLLQVFAITVRSKYMDVNQPAMQWKICITSNVFFAALVVSFLRLNVPLSLAVWKLGRERGVMISNMAILVRVIVVQKMDSNRNPCPVASALANKIILVLYLRIQAAMENLIISPNTPTLKSFYEFVCLFQDTNKFRPFYWHPSDLFSIFSFVGKQLIGQAFYNVNEKIYCEPDYKVSMFCLAV